MRALVVVLAVAIFALMSVAYKAFQQEMAIRRLRDQIASTTEQVKEKEDKIVNAKLKIQQLNDELVPLKKQTDGLVRKKEELTKAKGESETSLGTCQSRKVDSEKKKTEATKALEKLKEDQKAEERKVQSEVQALQNVIKARDLQICPFVDQALEEGRKLCADIKPAE